MNLSADLFPFISAAFSTFLLVLLAEIGDKSQLIIISLSTKYNGRLIFFVASLVYIILNTLAVLFGSFISDLIPEKILLAIVSLLFLIFGIHSLKHSSEIDEESNLPPTAKFVFFTTFLLLLTAEMGDKTQLSIVTLSTTYPAFSIWLGATCALILSAFIGVWVGKKLLKKLPVKVLHRTAGSLFLIFAFIAGIKWIRLF